MLPFSLFLLLVSHNWLSSNAETSFAQAAASAHVDTNLETPFLATTNILIEAKTLSHFASQKHGEMSTHIFHKRQTVSSLPLDAWVEVTRRFTEQVTLHTSTVKQTVQETLARVQNSEPAMYHIQEILEYSESIVLTLGRIQQQSDTHLVSMTNSPEDERMETNPDKDKTEIISKFGVMETRHMQNHWRLIRKEAEHVVHEAKRIKKNLIILKDSSVVGETEL